MKSYSIIKYLARYIFILTLISGGLYSCTDDPNDWSTDPSHDRLFKPLTFRNLKPQATSVDIIFSNIVEASKYVFEFKEGGSDEVAFTVELLSDTMKTIYSNPDNAVQREYLKVFDGLKGSTAYTVQMKGISKDGTRMSNYVELSFETAQEQLFNIDKAQISSDWAKFYWPAGSSVTHLSLTNIATGEKVLADSTLSSKEIESGEKLIEGLKSGMRYTARIYQDERLRGSIEFKTLGMPDGVTFNLMPGEDLSEILAEFVAAGSPNITIVFEPGEIYQLGAIKLPAGINALALTAPSGISKPQIYCENIQVNNAMDEISHENLNLSGDFTKRLYDLTLEVKNITFKGCDISEYNSIVRLRNNPMEMENVVIDDCFIKHIGNYGIYNLGGTSVKAGGLKLTNSTIVNIVGFMDIRSQVDSVMISNVTFYNATETLGSFLRFDGAYLPYKLSVKNNIFSGTNNGGNIGSTYGSYAGLTLSYAGSYMTNDLYAKITSNRPFTDITKYEGSAHDLFTDPDNFEFKIKPGAGFPGLGLTGDPRWFD